MLANRKNMIRRIINVLVNKSSHTSKLPSIIEGRSTNRFKTIIHVSAFNYGNAGDTLLPITLRDIWRVKHHDIKWLSQPVKPVVDVKLVNKINKTKGLVVGGGGLFLKDTNPNQQSGWQWPCSIELLDKIKVPVVLFAVGYNRFRNQEDFAPVFTQSIRAFAEKAVYLGIRNHGSIKQLKKYLPEELHHKLVFQPCMTTIISKLYPNIADYNSKEEFVALNAAFDRPHLRFGEKIGEVLSSIARVTKELSKSCSIKFYSHMKSDQAILPFLDAHNIKYELVDLQKVHPRQIVEQYARPKLVLGMRGHAQMIPFGCKTPVISIVSHNKMQYFLDDIKRPEWGADVLSDSFEADLLHRSLAILKKKDEIIKYIGQQQEEFYRISLKNVETALNAMFK
jgi:polysaccharide pyruvyl transferase WcaK-like protein